MPMDNVTIRISFEITKSDKIQPQVAQQIRSLEMQLVALKEQALAHSTVVTYNGLDKLQTFFVEKVALGALASLTEQAEAQAKGNG